MIRARRGWAARQDIESAGATVEHGTGRVRADLRAYGLAVMRHAIIDWSLDLPLSDAGFESDDFDAEAGDEIVAAIDAHYAQARRGTDSK